MARASGAAWTNTEATDWEANDYFRTDKFLQQVLQNIEYMAQTHDHTGDPDGATLTVADYKNIWYFGGANPSYG